MSDRKKFLWIAGFFLVFYFLPEGNERVAAGLTESNSNDVRLRQGARASLPYPGILHCGCNFGIHKPAVRNEISWRKG